MGFIAQTLKGTCNKLNVPRNCGHSCLIPAHCGRRDHFQSVPKKNLKFNNTYFTTRRCIYGPGSLFLLRHLCGLEEHKGHRYLPQARAGRHESVRRSNLNLQIQGSRSRCRVPPVFCGASTLFSSAFPSSFQPAPLYGSGCSAPRLDSWALRMSYCSQQTDFGAPSLVRSHDLEKTEALIFSPSSSQLSFYAGLQ